MHKIAYLLLLSAVACGSGPTEPRSLDFDATSGGDLQELGLYDSQSVIDYMATVGAGFNVPASSFISEPTEVALDLVDSGERLDVDLTLGRARLGPAFLDTGSSGVIVACGSWLTDDCSNLTVPQAFPNQEIYVTDIPVQRCYGSAATGSCYYGYVALASVSLGGVHAPMPFSVLNRAEVSATKQPADLDSLRLVGIAADLEDGFVSPAYYFDYAENLDVGLSISTTSMTLGLDSTEDWTTVQMRGSTQSVGTQVPLWNPYLPAQCRLDGGSSFDISVLLDTGTPPGEGSIAVSTAPDCSGGCTLELLFDGALVAEHFEPVTLQPDPDGTGLSIIGLEFLTGNNRGSGYMMNLSTGEAGIMAVGEMNGLFVEVDG